MTVATAIPGLSGPRSGLDLAVRSNSTRSATIANPSAEAAAITLHVYEGEMNACTVFLPTLAAAYRREVKTLSCS